MSDPENPFRPPAAVDRPPVAVWKSAIALLFYLGAISFGLLSALFIFAAIRWSILSGIRNLFIGLLLSAVFGGVAWGLAYLARRLRSSSAD